MGVKFRGLEFTPTKQTVRDFAQIISIMISMHFVWLVVFTKVKEVIMTN